VQQSVSAVVAVALRAARGSFSEAEGYWFESTLFTG